MVRNRGVSWLSSRFSWTAVTVGIVDRERALETAGEGRCVLIPDGGVEVKCCVDDASVEPARRDERE